MSAVLQHALELSTLFAEGAEVEFTFWGTPLLVWMLPLAHCVRVVCT